MAPVLVGTAAAETFSTVRFLLALVVALALQVAVNYANDCFDGVAGVDTPARVGPRRAVASGLASARQMRNAMLAALGVAAVSGLVLAALVGWELLLVGALAILATVGYSGGPRPYASLGLGELFVFVFFGLVATIGSAYVQDERIVPVAVAASIMPGLIAVALLVVNNLRDVPSDRAVGKRTLSVRIGVPGSRQLVGLCVTGAFLAPLIVTAMTASPWPLLAFLAAPLAARTVDLLRRAGRRGLVLVLGRTARLQLLSGIFFSVGLALV